MLYFWTKQLNINDKIIWAHDDLHTPESPHSGFSDKCYRHWNDQKLFLETKQMNPTKKHCWLDLDSLIYPESNARPLNDVSAIVFNGSDQNIYNIYKIAMPWSSWSILQTTLKNKHVNKNERNFNFCYSYLIFMRYSLLIERMLITNRNKVSLQNKTMEWKYYKTEVLAFWHCSNLQRAIKDMKHEEYYDKSEKNSHTYLVLGS